MDVSPETIRTVEFRERLRGYNQDDVDQFLERMAAGVEILQQRLRDASQRAARAEERPPQGEGEDALLRTLTLAQRTAELAVEGGREEAARLIQSAQGEAQSVVMAAQGEAEAVMADAEQRATRLIEETQGSAAAEVHRLQARREHLNAEIVALERHLAQARARAYTSLTDAARQIEHLVPDPAPEPMTELTEAEPMPLVAEAGSRHGEPGTVDVELAASATPSSSTVEAPPSPDALGHAPNGAPSGTEPASLQS